MISGGNAFWRPISAGFCAEQARRRSAFQRHPVRRSMEFGAISSHSYMIPNLQYTCPSICGPQRGHRAIFIWIGNVLSLPSHRKERRDEKQKAKQNAAMTHYTFGLIYRAL